MTEIVPQSILVENYILAKAPVQQQDLLLSLTRNGANLVGSRLMNLKYPDTVQVNPATDWDFCMDYSESAQNYLENQGFKKFEWQNLEEQPNEYLDISATELWQWGSDFGAPVQVVLRVSSTDYADMFNSIGPDFYVDYIWKSGPNKPDYHKIRGVINQLCQVYSTGQTSKLVDHILGEIKGEKHDF